MRDRKRGEKRDDVKEREREKREQKGGLAQKVHVLSVSFPNIFPPINMADIHRVWMGKDMLMHGEKRENNAAPEFL